MRNRLLSTPLWLGLWLLVLAGCAPPSTGPASPAQIHALAPGMARVWILRQANAPGGNVEAADPMVYVNGTPIAPSAAGTAYYRDFAPGTYRFTVQAYGTPTGLGDTYQLVPETQTYLQVMGVPNWQLGSSVGGGSFALLAMSPQTAMQYLPTMTDLGPR
ncbi:MAG TPA: hypothetical protein VGP52_01060 [Stellaceae bacterium]|nr:hypothetical protein [Stellaceae bacterium]